MVVCVIEHGRRDVAYQFTMSSGEIGAVQPPHARHAGQPREAGYSNTVDSAG